MRNNTLIFFTIASVWAPNLGAAPSSLRHGRRLAQCDRINSMQTCQIEDGCKVWRRSGQKNLCVDDNVFERCRDFDREKECWKNFPECVWTGNSNRNGRCEDRGDTDIIWCNNDNDCRRRNDDMICVPFRFASITDPCLDYSEQGQCILQPQECSTDNRKVCGCNDEIYDNACECLKDGERIKYEGACSTSRDRDLRQAQRNYVRDHDLDDSDYFGEYMWRYMRESVRTGGNYCLDVLECKKQLLDIDGLNRFRVVSDPYNCGCYVDGNVGVWSDHNRCNLDKVMAPDLQRGLERVGCNLERLYRDVRNVRTDTCLSVRECDDQCFEDGELPVSVRNDPSSNKCGCYRKGRQCYWNSCGNNQDKSTESMPGKNERVWCNARVRDVRDVVDETCLNRNECEFQGELNGNVKTPAIVKDFNSDNNCGCYKKGGQLYWAVCGSNGNFYGELGGLKDRVHCHDVGTSSYRLFNRQGVHSHPHTHPHYDDDHYHDDDWYYDDPI